LIGRRDVLWAAVVETTDRYQELVGPWQSNEHGLDLSAGVSRITNTWRKTPIKAEELLSEPVCWATVDYDQVSSPDVRAEISWRTSRAGTAHGFVVWFDADLADGIGFSNRPGAPELIYGQGFFPFPQPIKVSDREQVELEIRADFVQGDYVWTWTTDFTDQKIAFRQSTFYAAPLSAKQLRKTYAQHS
jgi:protein arginine N-methyltransferase 1